MRRDGLGQNRGGRVPGLRLGHARGAICSGEATDVAGYIPYAHACPRPDLTLHASDNHAELERAQDSSNMALAGKVFAAVW